MDCRKDLRLRNKKVAENRKTAAKMGVLCEERSKNSRGARKVVRTFQQGTMGKLTKVDEQRSYK